MKNSELRIIEPVDAPTIEAESEEFASLSRALGHPHRISILRFLAKQDACVCGKIVDLLPVAQSTVSQHLKKLKDAGWIEGEIDPPRVCYCIRPETLARFRDLLNILIPPPLKLSVGDSKMETKESIRAVVRERYGRMVAGSSDCGCGPGCCSPAGDFNDIAVQIGYDQKDLTNVPESSNLGLGCGAPLEHASVQPGETVLDLGSGAGFDCFLAARLVGETGHVIGVDMTPEMLERARANAKEAGFTNAEFRMGEIEHLPVADNSVDVIISNCVINLSPEKEQVFREALRVLKPGGRVIVSDLVLRRELSPQLKNSVEAYVGCIAGASRKEDYLQMMRNAGFRQVEVVEERVYDVGLDMLGSQELAEEALAAVVSVKVKAFK
jgi:SAM-dependent methyltransferase/DNA-binding transcriptional ArsR family regulator